jgi:broad specificity phosphatase PhoE
VGVTGVDVTRVDVLGAERAAGRCDVSLAPDHPERIANPLVLVRHGHAGERWADQVADRGRPLDARGRDQAAGLPGSLASAIGGHRLPQAMLVSSPTTRCVGTLEPLAEAYDRELTTDERLAEVEPPLPSRDGWPDAAWLGARAMAVVDEFTNTHPGAPVIVCSHGEILPALVATVVARQGRRVPPSLDLTRKAVPKGSAWVLAAGSGSVEWIAASDGG